MKKLNRNYLSFFEWLHFWSSPDAEKPQGYSVRGNRYHDGSIENLTTLREKFLELRYKVYPYYQFLGSFRPLRKMYKDFSDTFEPYHSTGKLIRDLLQPFRGFFNIFKGIITLVGSVILLAAYCVASLFVLCMPNVYASFFPIIVYPLSWILEGTFNILRGVTQILSAPLVYFCKTPLRGILTCLQKEPKFVEDKPEIKRLAQEAKDQLSAIHHKAKITELDAMKVKLEEYRAHINSGDYKQAAKINLACNQSRKTVASILYEVQRKYTNSVKDRWDTRCKPEEVKSSYQAAFPIFKAAASVDIVKAHLEPSDMPIDAKEKAESYLSIFLK